MGLLWADRPEQRPAPATLRRQLRAVRERGFAINAGKTESGVTAVDRAVRDEHGRAERLLWLFFTGQQMPATSRTV